MVGAGLVPARLCSPSFWERGSGRDKPCPYHLSSQKQVIGNRDALPEFEAPRDASMEV
jgi:hypothetical protein